MFAESRLFIIYSSCSSLLFDLWWWLGDFVWIGLWRLNFAAPLPQPGFNLLAGAREIPSHPSDPSQDGWWLTQTCLLEVSRCPEYRSSANNIPRVIIPSSGSKSVSSIIFRIITKHYYSFSIWPQSPRQITIRSMFSMSQPRRCRVTGLLSVCRWPQLNNFIPTRNLLHNPCSPLKRI